jgi:hypothetical protein
MIFDIALASDTAAGGKTRYIVTLKEEMKVWFKDKDYGKDVLKCILLVSVFSSPRKINTPTYVDHKVKINRFTGMPIEMNKLFMYDIHFNQEEYAKFITADEDDARKQLAGMLLDSLYNLEKLPKKVKDFDKQRFKVDMQEFFRRQHLI